MQFEVVATDGRRVEVHAVDWMMAMAQAMPILGIEVSGWMCNPRADGTVDVMDPMSGASWRVRKLGAEAPEPRPPAQVHAGPPPVPAALLSGVAEPAPEPAAPPPKRTPPTERPGAITEMWSRARPRYDDEDDDDDEDDASEELELPEPAPPDDLAERLFDVSTDLYQADSPTAACRMALDILLQLVPCEAGSVLRGQRDEGMLTFVATAGPAAKQLLGQKMHFGQGVVGASFDLGITILVHDVASDARHLARFDQQTGFQTRSVLCAPLRHQYNMFGAVELINPLEGRFRAWHVEAMETVARCVGQILAGAR